MNLTGKCKKEFLLYSKWYYVFLPGFIQNLIIFKWFNCHTKIAIHLQNWPDDGFDYAVYHPYLDKVFISIEKGGYRNKNFELNILRAIKKANEIYNEINI